MQKLPFQRDKSPGQFFASTQSHFQPLRFFLQELFLAHHLEIFEKQKFISKSLKLNGKSPLCSLNLNNNLNLIVSIEGEILCNLINN